MVVDQQCKAEGTDGNRDHNQDRDPIVIVGAGMFGLSTALALLRRATSSAGSSPSSSPSSSSSSVLAPPILILDSSASLPNPSGSSVDSSRIVRADYPDSAYSDLAREAQGWWRDQSDGGWGGQGRYTQSGFVVVVEDGEGEGGGPARRYVQEALKTVTGLSERMRELDDGSILEGLDDVDAIRKVMSFPGSGPRVGGSGFVNWGSGWADAEASVKFALDELKRRDVEGRVTIATGSKVRRLTYVQDLGTEIEKPRCTGLELENGQVIKASLIVLATGAWTPTLVDLRGQAIATGQVLVYMDLEESEQSAMGDKPVLMNFNRGIFLIPPRNRKLKLARHGFGYRNPKMVPRSSLDVPTQSMANLECSTSMEAMIEISVPEMGTAVPAEGQQACREMLRDIFPNPSISERPFTRTRVCWYCDTLDGNFLIDWHPDCSRLFLATGGSGHGFKFLPVIGEKIVDAIEGDLAPSLRSRWQWRPGSSESFEVTNDLSRAGSKGMTLSEEIGKTE